MIFNCKRRFTKLFSVLLAAVLLCGMTGCDGNREFGTVSDKSSVVFEPVSVPEGGWTIETVARTVCIDGKPIEYPFTIGGLGKEFTINKNDTQILESGAAGTVLYKDGIPILNVEFQNITGYNQINSAKPSGFSSYYKDRNSIEKNVHKIVSINGIQLGASKSDIESAFGQPESVSDRILSYKDKNTDKTCVGFWLNDNDELYSFTVILD